MVSRWSETSLKSEILFDVKEVLIFMFWMLYENASFDFYSFLFDYIFKNIFILQFV